MGAYEAGALHGMYHGVQDKTELQYDVVTGVSAGSINTFAVALHEKGDEANMVEFMQKAWEGVDDSQVYKMWPNVTDFMHESGVLDDSPLFKFMYDIGEPLLPFKRKYMLTAANVNTGAVVKFTEQNFTDKNTEVREALSSSSVPFIFPNQNWESQLENTVLMDGGTIFNLNLVGAVHRCREQVQNDY